MEITIPGVAAAYGPLVQPSVALQPVAPAVDPLAVGVAGWSDHGQPNDPTPVELRSGAEPPEGMLRISKTGEEELFIWPVHRREWLALGWRVVGAADGGPTPLVHAPLVSGPLVSAPLVLAPLVPEVDQPAELSAQVTGQVALPEATAVVLPEVVTPAVVLPAAVLPAVVLPDFEVMTKAQIIDFCGVNYGVQLDGSATKAVLVEQALVLAGKSEQLDSPGSVTPGAVTPGDMPPGVPSDLLV